MTLGEIPIAAGELEYLSIAITCLVLIGLLYMVESSYRLGRIEKRLGIVPDREHGNVEID